MAGEMDKNKQGGQTGSQSNQTQEYGGQKSGQTGQQQQGNVDPNKKNPTQGNQQDEQDRTRRAS